MTSHYLGLDSPFRGREADLAPSSPAGAGTRQRAAAPYTSKYRSRRAEALSRIVADIIARKGRCSIIDVGGTTRFWALYGHSFDWERTTVQCVNRDPEHAFERDAPANVSIRRGDARDLGAFGDASFDIAFSNSVIEHVGLYADMERMASEIRRVAESYFVQTPYYWFPYEPHAHTPVLHWLPQPLAVRIVMAKRCGFWARQAEVGAATRTVQSAILLTIRQFQALFPDAEIQRERLFGLTKSLVAVRA